MFRKLSILLFLINGCAAQIETTADDVASKTNDLQTHTTCTTQTSSACDPGITATLAFARYYVNELQAGTEENFTCYDLDPRYYNGASAICLWDQDPQHIEFYFMFYPRPGDVQASLYGGEIYLTQVNTRGQPINKTDVGSVSETEQFCAFNYYFAPTQSDRSIATLHFPTSGDTSIGQLCAESW